MWLPVRHPISKYKFRRNLGRTQLAVVLEQGTEHDGLDVDGEIGRQLMEVSQLQVGKWRDEAEQPACYLPAIAGLLEKPVEEW